jgi:hypothetical protein
MTTQAIEKLIGRYVADDDVTANGIIPSYK